MMMKVIEGTVTSGFGYRIHPLTGQQGSFHNGVDISAPIGTEICSPIDGEVKSVYDHATGGKTLIIGNDSGLRFGFAHLSRVCFPAGNKIKKGSLIAYSGNTGKSTGPHLHFTVKTGGRWNNGTYEGGSWEDPVKFIDIKP